MMKVEERKSAPLPPLPWSTQNEPRYDDATWVLDANGHTIAECYGPNNTHQALAALLLRAPALEAELKQAFEDHQEVCAEVINLRALLRELAIAATVYQDSVDSGLDARLEAGVGLSEVLRRAEAEAGEEKQG